MAIQKKFVGRTSIAESAWASWDGRVRFVQDLVHAVEPIDLPRHVDAPEAYLDCTKCSAELEEYAQRGHELLRENSVAILMLAGGVARRMGMKGLRGDIRIGPVTKRTIFQLQGQKIAALRARYESDIPWLVMTSPMVHDATVQSFQRNGYFGLAERNVWWFSQPVLPVLDAQMSPVRLSNGEWLENPTGHGGMFSALTQNKMLERLAAARVEYLFAFHYPNVLEKVCDPVLLGYHHAGGFEVTTKAFRQYAPSETVGRLVTVDGRTQIVEYQFVDAERINPRWNSLPANMATHVWSVAFLQRCQREGVQLPYYPLPYRLAGREELVRLEQFVCDLLPAARTTGLVLVDRSTEYAPAKTQEGIDSLKGAREALARVYRCWLDQAGAIAETSDCTVEVSPHFALDAEELCAKIRPGFRYTDGTQLS